MDGDPGAAGERGPELAGEQHPQRGDDQDVGDPAGDAFVVGNVAELVGDHRGHLLAISLREEVVVEHHPLR